MNGNRLNELITKVELNEISKLLNLIEKPYAIIKGELSMLFVQYNSIKVLKKHVFIRKIQIPYYVNGIHPYWNSEILCFINKQYYAAYESGSELKIVK